MSNVGAPGTRNWRPDLDRPGRPGRETGTSFSTAAPGARNWHQFSVSRGGAGASRDQQGEEGAGRLLPVGAQQDGQDRRAEVERVVLGRRGRKGRGPTRRRRGGRGGWRGRLLGHGVGRRRCSLLGGRLLRGQPSWPPSSPVPSSQREPSWPPSSPQERPRRERRPIRPPELGPPPEQRRERQPPPGSAGPAPIRDCRQSTNWASSLSETSCITPRPNCAGLPVICSSVTTSTRVDEGPSSSNVAVTCAPAVPLPRLSRPFASSTSRRPASSRSTKVPEPEYCSAIGPSFTLQVPWNDVALDRRDHRAGEALGDRGDVLERRPGGRPRRPGTVNEWVRSTRSRPRGGEHGPAGQHRRRCCAGSRRRR